MAQFFVSAGHGGYENGVLDPGYVLGNTTEAAQMRSLRDMVLAELRAQGYDALPVPDDLSAAQTITWINERCNPKDVALELHAGVFPDTSVRGAAVFYVVNNEARKIQADLLLTNLLQAVPQLTSRGALPDTEFSSGSSAFCRQIGCPSLLMETMTITNPDDRALLQNQRRDFAIGIANGMKVWSGLINTQQIAGDYPPVAISVNGQSHPEPGIIIDDRAFIPVNIIGLLGLNLSQLTDVRRVLYSDQVYLRAADLSNHNVKVTWQAPTRTVFLQSSFQLPFCPGRADLIMGRGATTEAQLLSFLTSLNPAVAPQHQDLPRVYREEASIEGVNYDIAFSQMLVETNELTNAEVLTQNNFGGLASASGGSTGAGFPDARTGVRAHIQHLKAYGSVEPLVLRLVDPRFDFVQRGIAPLVHMLTDRWNTMPNYDEKITRYQQQLYGSVRP